METFASKVEISLGDRFRCVVECFGVLFDNGAVGSGSGLSSVRQAQQIGIEAREGIQEGDVAAFFARIRHINEGHVFLANPKQAATGKLDKVIGRAVQTWPKCSAHCIQPFMNRRLGLVVSDRRLAILL